MTAQVLTLLKPRSVGIWVRVSTEFQALGDSPHHHEERAREYAAAKGWTVESVYRLEAVSGKSVLWHSEAKRMLEDIKMGRITGLIASKFARLARNTRELLEISDLFQEHRAELISLDEPINITTSTGRLFLTVMSGLAEWEREEIAGRVSASLPIRAKLGKPLGGAAPFGYKWEGKQLLINPTEAPVRALIYTLYIEHKRLKSTARALNELGHRTRNGSKFSDTTVSRLIADPTAKGMRRANYTRSVNHSKAWIVKPRSEWVMVAVEACVSEEVWDRANMILGLQQDKLRRKCTGVKNLFAGLVFCGCSQKMYIWTHSPKYVCQKCRAKIRDVDLETFFLEGVRSMFAPEQVRLLFNRAHEDLRLKQSEISSLSEQMVAIRAEMDKCYRAFISEHLDEEDFGRFYNPLKMKLREAESVLAELNGQRALLEHWCVSRTPIVKDVFEVLDKWWGETSFTRKQTFLENLVKRIDVRDDHIHVEFHHLATLKSEGQFDFSGFAMLCGLEVSIPKDLSKQIPEDSNGRRLVAVA